MDSILQALKAPMIQSGNWLLSFTVLTVWAAFHYLAVRRWDILSDFTRRVVGSLFPVVFGLSIYFPWFAVSRKTASPGETHNQWMADWRFVMISLAGLMVAYGFSRFVGLIFDWPDNAHWLLFSGLVSAALLVGLY